MFPRRFSSVVLPFMACLAFGHVCHAEVMTVGLLSSLAMDEWVSIAVETRSPSISRLAILDFIGDGARNGYTPNTLIGNISRYRICDDCSCYPINFDALKCNLVSYLDLMLPRSPEIDEESQPFAIIVAKVGGGVGLLVSFLIDGLLLGCVAAYLALRIRIFVTEI